MNSTKTLDTLTAFFYLKGVLEFRASLGMDTTPEKIREIIKEAEEIGRGEEKEVVNV